MLDEFRSLRWMPLQPKHLDYANSQILLIGEGIDTLGKATNQQPGDEKEEKDTPLEEMEKLEDEDERRVEGLKGMFFHTDTYLGSTNVADCCQIGDDSVFEDLGLSSNEYSKIPTTW